MEEKRVIWYEHVREANFNRWITRVSDWSLMGRRKIERSYYEGTK